MKKKLDLRILQIDLGRQIETVEYLKSYIDFAKENHYNAVLLYLEAAVKVECTPFFHDDETYTPEEIKELVAYGNEKGIDIIPALENLAHAENFLQYKELEFLSETKDAGENARGVRNGSLGDCICTSNPKACEFMDLYYTQVLSLFTSQYAHAGMDEPFDFATCPRCVARLQNGETKKDIFYTHLMRTYNVLKAAGRENVVRLFAYCDINTCIRRVEEVDGVDSREALRRVNRISKQRRDYYKYYTGKEWEDMANYDLLINMSDLEVGETVDLVKKYLETKGII